MTYRVLIIRGLEHTPAGIQRDDPSWLLELRDGKIRASSQCGNFGLSIDPAHLDVLIDDLRLLRSAASSEKWRKQQPPTEAQRVPNFDWFQARDGGSTTRWEETV